MKRISLKRPLVATLISLALLTQETWALAGTTGSLSGVVTDDSRVPVAAADVKAVSASQTAQTTTDSTGHFVFLSLAPDTYTVSIEKSGYNPVSYAGATVFADQQQTLALRLNKALKEIAKVSSRATGALIRPGTTSDVYSVNSATAGKLTGLGGGGGLDNAYSAIATVPGAFVPMNQTGWFQNVVIRGGDFDQVGYEVDGVPVNRSFDNYPSSTASALGQQEVQVYTGANPANSESQGLSGFINQVIKTGTYPGFASSDLGLGAPVYYHKASVEAGGASPDRLFSYYAGFGGYNQDYRLVDQSNGASLNASWGAPIDWQLAPDFNPATSSCTSTTALADVSNDLCYAATQNNGLFPSAGPGGFIQGSLSYGANTATVFDRENVVNFHFGIPHKRDGGRDDLQLMYQTSSLNTQFYNSPLDPGPNSFLAFDAANGLSPVYTLGPPASTTPAFVHGFAYTGAIGQPLQTVAGAPGTVTVAPSSIVNYCYPSQAALGCGSLIPASLRDGNNNGIGIEKLQYQRNFGSSAYLRVYGYMLYSNWMLYGPNTTVANFVGPNPPDYELTSHTRGISATYALQLNPHNLLNAQASYITATTTRNNNSQMVNGSLQLGVLVNANDPASGICYNNGGAPGAATPTACTSALGGTPSQFRMNAVSRAAANNDPSLYTCGGGPCEFLAVNGGPQATYNQVKPTFTAASLTDEWDPTDRFHVNLGLRWDSYKFVPSDTSGPARNFYFNAWNQSMCANQALGVYRPVPKANVALGCNDPANVAAFVASGLPSPTTASPYATATLSNTGETQTFKVLQPRVGITYTVNARNVIRASYGKYDQAPNAAFEQYNTLQQDLASFIGLRMFQYGRTQTTFPIAPPISYNTDVSWESQLKGTDMSFKLTPFYRHTNNQIQQFFLDPKTSFTSGLNVGSQTSDGVEFQFQKGDFSRNGFAALLSYTYTYASVKYSTLSNGNSILTPINGAIQNYNSYTSYCASNPASNLCGGPLKASNVAAHAAPCFTTAGAPVANAASCTGADVANPYWNAPAQGLLDINASYTPYDIFPGPTGVGDYQTFIAPSVATIVLNYKHGSFAITPAFQYSAGQRYGYPLSSVGVDPSKCGATLGIAPDTARYPYGAAGAGAAYDATSCASLINIPNPDTAKFDGLGAFVGPSQWTMNTQLSYDVNPRITAVVTLANIFDRCSGGTKGPWTNPPGIPSNDICGYTYGPGAAGLAGVGLGTSILPVGNVYNPGATIQPFVAHAYGPSLGSYVPGSSAPVPKLPFNVYFDLKIKL